MTPRQVAALAIRLFAICLSICVLRLIPSFTFVASGSRVVSFQVFLFVVTGFVAALLWFFPGTVARRIVPSTAENLSPATSPDAWFTTGCALIGMWVLASAIPALIRDAFIVYASDTLNDTSTVKSWILYNLIEVAVGFWLIVGARGFRRLYLWGRDAGSRKAL